MELYGILSEVIDLRSFSNLWYWIVLAVLWSSASHWVLGVPYDLISRGRRSGGQAQLDVEAMVAINSRRMLNVTRTAAIPLFFGVAFFFTTLAMLAFWYWLEFAQALFLLTVWLVPVGWLSLWTALRIEAGENIGEALNRRLMILRRLVQVLGMFAIFITSLFGMWRNLSYTVFH
ncbi:component of SufBCD complex [Paracoccus sp. IB05]|uniref:component of SufBCD complex n=1 Tax=Paracoccus sp. IB05 TaxID=2779367 RepID=UPI0018E73EAF|nr:component of SufBCD complex [Paracoccus sp. IB05]MBJ2151726.1 component of SufBCD complex [Paracoccus sp. IB05]